MTMQVSPPAKFRWSRNNIAVIAVLLIASEFMAFQGYEWLALWPSLVALVGVFFTRSALVGLLTGAISGALLIAKGSLWDATTGLVVDRFFPIFTSQWRISALLFTLILGGFVTLIEAGGGLQSLLRKAIGTNASPKRIQTSVFGFGLLVFFDGLSNSMLVGRLLRSTVDRAGVSREKLAYLADTTSSAVACLAFISTWIAFQLSLIRDGYALAGEEVNAYSLFFQSLPTNFYCIFALMMLGVCITRNFNPGPMQRAETLARQRIVKQAPETTTDDSHWSLAIVPIAVLIFSVPLLAYSLGSDSLLPITLPGFAEAYAKAENYVPFILIFSGVLASLVAALVLWSRKQHSFAHPPVLFVSGVRDLLGPMLILLAAWMLGSTISDLGAVELLSKLFSGRVTLEILPVAIFAVGALVSFTTGTSWGTMAVLMPLAIPTVFALTGDAPDTMRDQLMIATIGAVFSGAVFGDHCSPFSDTTIVASIASGTEPLEHVRTQLPFALITALVAGVLGFVPLGYGVSPWLCLLFGFVVLMLISLFPTAPKPQPEGQQS